jgi:phosphatidylserine decarboxylase
MQSDAGAIRYVDRRDGVTRAERVFGGDTLDLLYGHPLLRLLTDSILCRRIPNQIYGWLQRRPSTRARIPAFVESLGIDASEAELPLDRYRSLDDFFARKLRPGARPVDPAPGHLVAPADGRALVFTGLAGRALPVKGAQVPLEDLLGDSLLAERYCDGDVLVIRLAPADYHRFHFPDSGTAGPWREIDGPLHSVHPIALGAGAPSFLNKRQITVLESRHFGPVALAEVGALCVGTVVQTYRPGPVERGAEKGFFRFGGSTVVLLLQAGRVVFDADLIRNTRAGLETLIRTGTRIAVGLEARTT